MKRTFASKFLAALLSVTVCAGLASCAGTGATEASISTGVEEGRKGEIAPSEVPSDVPTNSSEYSKSKVSHDKLTGVNYVMIYDPYIYDENNKYDTGTGLSTGRLDGQIITGQSRAGDDNPDDLGLHDMISQSDINGGLEGLNVNFDGSRASGFDPVYKLGDKHTFYHYDKELKSREEDKFKCVYEGDHCYVWSLDDSISKSDASKFGEEFDNVIYGKDVQCFGTPRFVENGGKVNILFYEMRRDLGGFFAMVDIYSSAEVTKSDISRYGLNTDHAIININSTRVKTDPDFVKSTLSHEFQHLICASDTFKAPGTPFMRTWLNESMSAFAEDYVYSGIKNKGRYNILYYLSDRFRKGQSLYNFSIENDQYIGAYGTVYLFAEYLEKHAGTEVFSNIHRYWADKGYPQMTESEALYYSVPESFRNEIAGKYDYSSEVSGKIGSEYDQWMSKLTLDFFIETTKPDLARLNSSEQKYIYSMLYDEVNPTTIEGGGRIFVATDNGTFEIPDDADKGLIYVGFDKDFNVVGIA